MSLIKKLSKSLIFPSMMGLNMDKIMRSFAKNTLLNVMYHGVVEKDSTFFSPRHITKDRFESHLKYFKKNFNIISVYEAFEMLQNGKTPDKKTITLSFDDGYTNNLNTALPLLEKYNLPTTFFISSMCIENKEKIWSDWIDTYYYAKKNAPISFGSYSFDEMNMATKHKIFSILKNASCSERDAYLSELIDKYSLEKHMTHLDDEIYSLMTENELKRLADSNIVTIGSHGHKHYNLGLIDLENAKKEMLTSKKLLEETTGKKIDIIAYPDGSYSREVKELATELGFKYQMAVDFKYPEDHQDIRIMNRHCMSSATTFGSNMIMLSKCFYNKGINIKK